MGSWSSVERTCSTLRTAPCELGDVPPLAGWRLATQCGGPIRHTHEQGARAWTIEMWRDELMPGTCFIFPRVSLDVLRYCIRLLCPAQNGTADGTFQVSGVVS